MKIVGTEGIPVSSVEVGERLRSVDEQHVKGLAGLIEENGFTHPLLVARGKKGNYRLIDGAHRLEACKRFGIEVVQATIAEANEHEILLQEVLSELHHQKLNPLDRAVFIAAGKEAYEELYPETKHGAQGGRGGQKIENEMFSFSKKMAETLEVSERAIERWVKIANIPAKHREVISTLPIAEKEGELYNFAKEGKDQQAKILKALSRKENPVSTVKAAVKEIDGHTPVKVEDKAFLAITDKWNRASKAEQTRFLHERIADGSFAAAQETYVAEAGE